MTFPPSESGVQVLFLGWSLELKRTSISGGVYSLGNVLVPFLKEKTIRLNLIPQFFNCLAFNKKYLSAQGFKLMLLKISTEVADNRIRCSVT